MALRISEKGWVVIPSQLRKRYALSPGTEVQIVDYGGVLAIIPVRPHPVETSAGMLSGGKPLTEALLEDHRRDLEDE